MKQVSGKDLIAVVQRHGWTLLRVNGSHHIFGKLDQSFVCQFRFTGIAH